ncbi:MAG: hypothetical protein IRY85_14940 [Micromonosporaceae bacterium]|nr:hypothetical protein [Micromonosporaceae bacterium]
MPENTTNRDPVMHLLGALTEGASVYIENMERDGQRQLVASTDLPTKGSEDPEFAKLGFTFGDPYPDDPLFRPATLPTGWRREGSDHPMWSYIVDDRGRRRVAVFYKAAFYDRRADMRLETVYSYAWSVLFGDIAGPEFDDSWCTRAAFADALDQIRQLLAERIARYESQIDNPSLPWVASELEKTRADLAKVEAVIAQHSEES